MAEHSILFDPIADRFILVVICGSHKERRGIYESECVTVVDARSVHLLNFVIFWLIL